jgi:hypothetical protein
MHSHLFVSIAQDINVYYQALHHDKFVLPRSWTNNSIILDYEVLKLCELKRDIQLLNNYDICNNLILDKVEMPEVDLVDIYGLHMVHISSVRSPT